MPSGGVQRRGAGPRLDKVDRDSNPAPGGIRSMLQRLRVHFANLSRCRYHEMREEPPAHQARLKVLFCKVDQSFGQAGKMEIGVSSAGLWWRKAVLLLV